MPDTQQAFKDLWADGLTLPFPGTVRLSKVTRLTNSHIAVGIRADPKTDLSGPRLHFVE